MRTIKLIIGIGCLVASLPAGLLYLDLLRRGCFSNPEFALAGSVLALALPGILFIRKRNSPISWQLKMMSALAVCAGLGFIVIILIPALVGGLHVSSANACRNNLCQINAAKNLWALENHQTNGAVVTENDLKPYLKLKSDGNFPGCPHGGKYTIGRLGEDPTCSIGTATWPNCHVLTNPDRWTTAKLAYRMLLGLSPPWVDQ